MIPAGGDQKFYNNFLPNETDAFRQADNFKRSQAKSNAQIRREQANPTLPAGEKKTEQPRDKGGRKRKSSSAEILRYPYDIMDESTDFLQIEVLKYNPPGLGVNGDFGIRDGTYTNPNSNLEGETKIKFAPDTLTNFKVPDGTTSHSGEKKEILKTIFLPIPKNIADNNQIDWGETGINALEAFGLKFGQEFINEGPLEAAKLAFQAGGDAFSDKAFGGDAQKAIINAISAQAIQTLGGQVRPGDLISRATGQVLNPNLELLFENVTLRSFKFSFEFFPRNRKEAEVVMKIIRCFKTHSAPKKNGGIFLSAPDIFQLSYRKGSNPHPFLNTFKPTVLTNVNVNYTASNVYSTFYDGTPTHMIMELSFKELNPIYEENYYEEEQFVGPLANPDEAVTTPPTGGVGY